MSELSGNLLNTSICCPQVLKEPVNEEKVTEDDKFSGKFQVFNALCVFINPHNPLKT